MAATGPEPPKPTRRERWGNVQRLLHGAAAPSPDLLAAYWRGVANPALHYLGRRPLTLVRHLNGRTFFHTGALPPVAPAVHTIQFEKRQGGEGTRLWVDSLEGLLGLIEIGVVELHPWAATIDDIEHPDMIVFDLDPGMSIPWEPVVVTAKKLRDLLRAEGLDPWPKTTGGKGLHISAGIDRVFDHDQARAYCRRIAERLAAEDPARYTIRSGPGKRPGKIFIDYLRNGRGQTAIGAFSPRARPGFPVAAPVRWEDLDAGVRPDTFTIAHPPRPRARRRASD
jgi:bifunctional non-homologous end joining protein LigD